MGALFQMVRLQLALVALASSLAILVIVTSKADAFERPEIAGIENIVAPYRKKIADTLAADPKLKLSFDKYAEKASGIVGYGCVFCSKEIAALKKLNNSQLPSMLGLLKKAGIDRDVVSREIRDYLMTVRNETKRGYDVSLDPGLNVLLTIKPTFQGMLPDQSPALPPQQVLIMRPFDGVGVLKLGGLEGVDPDDGTFKNFTALGKGETEATGIGYVFNPISAYKAVMANTTASAIVALIAGQIDKPVVVSAQMRVSIFHEGADVCESVRDAGVVITVSPYFVAYSDEFPLQQSCIAPIVEPREYIAKTTSEVMSRVVGGGGISEKSKAVSSLAAVTPTLDVTNFLPK